MFRLPATCRSHILIFPGVLFCFLIGLLLAGIDRKIVAKMQKRVGPPVLQPFYDFFKLCGKETIVPAAANKGMFLGAPLLGLAALVVLQMFIPVSSFTAFSTMADVIVILHMVATKEEDLIVSGTFFKAAPKKPAPKPAAAAAAPKAEAAPAAGVIKPREDGKPVQVPSKCVYCTLCAKKCPDGALTVDRAARRWTLDEDSCVACGTCATVRPKNAIEI